MSVKITNNFLAKIVSFLFPMIWLSSADLWATGACEQIFSKSQSEYEVFLVQERASDKWVYAEKRGRKLLKEMGINENSNLANHLRVLENKNVEVLAQWGSGYRVVEFQLHETRAIKNLLLKVKHKSILDIVKIQNEYREIFDEVASQIEDIAVTKNYAYTYRLRLKSLHKVKGKIFDRAGEYMETHKRPYMPSTDLTDIVASRLVVPAKLDVFEPLWEKIEIENKRNKDLKEGEEPFEYVYEQKYLRAHFKKYFPNAKHIQIEVKNKKSGYRAVHIDVTRTDGKKFEVQFISEGMKLWDLWQHDLIYKLSGKESLVVKENFAKYSKIISNIIYKIEYEGQKFSLLDINKLDLDALGALNLTRKPKFHFPHYEWFGQLTAK